ncbi:MAG: hypothetical protein ACUVS3_04785 [Thermodesulfobacteriota bacterium]
MGPAGKPPADELAVDPERLESALEECLGRAMEAPGSLEHYRFLQAVLRPILRRPGLPETLVRLAAQWEPESAEEVIHDLRAWAKSVNATLRTSGWVERPPPLVSRTLADLFFRQGHLKEAERIYRILMERDPGDDSVLREYRERFGKGEAESGKRQLLRALEELAERIRRARIHG